uniref:Uncharacterized protein n=1 Tax=Knipowitschia caucasica TaxID=637954 RepID=A0AAV2JIC8_KNICA
MPVFYKAIRQALNPISCHSDTRQHPPPPGDRLQQQYPCPPHSDRPLNQQIKVLRSSAAALPRLPIHPSTSLFTSPTLPQLLSPLAHLSLSFSPSLLLFSPASLFASPTSPAPISPSSSLPKLLSSPASLSPAPLSHSPSLPQAISLSFSLCQPFPTQIPLSPCPSPLVPLSLSSILPLPLSPLALSISSFLPQFLFPSASFSSSTLPYLLPPLFLTSSLSYLSSLHQHLLSS